MQQLVPYLWLIPLGAFAGAYGTMIGAGGGFILVPALLLLYPSETPETITSISLTVVCFNALSGTLAYAKTGRIDYKAGIAFSLATVPGAVLGALATAAVDRDRFDPLFGFLLFLVGVFLTVVPGKTGAAAVAQMDAESRFELTRRNLILGFALSTGLGFLSSFLGIGGGFLYVPLLVYVLKFLVHTAIATSLFILTTTSLAGAVTHIAAGLFHHGVRRAIMLSIGAIIGAQIGAKLSRRMRGDWIIRSLAVAVSLVGLRFILSSLY